MKWIENNTAKIKSLIKAGGIDNLTYAALEARLAIETVCYDRLRISHDYISQEDLMGWQPARIVLSLINEIDQFVAAEYSLSISSTGSLDEPCTTREDYERYEYIDVGTQASLDPKVLGRLWNALGNFLHVRLPTSKDDAIQRYADEEKLISKLSEALHELDKISRGNLITSGFGMETKFQCNCGRENRRRIDTLKSEKIVSCINPRCNEQWLVELRDNDIVFHRREISIECDHCGALKSVAANDLMQMKFNDEKILTCECGRVMKVLWMLCREVHPQSEAPSPDSNAPE